MTRIWNRRALLVSVLAFSPAPLPGVQQSLARGAAPSEASDPTDSRLMNELANRGLDSLLDRYFEIHHVPEAQQKAIRSFKALRELNDPSKKLSNSERERRVKQVVEGLKTTLPNMKDPVQLATDANALMQAGVIRDANLLEYWGENPATQSRLRPVAEAVYQMLGQVARDAETQATALANRMNSSTSAVANRWEQMDSLAKTAKYRQEMMAYFVALSLPRDQRGKVTDEALDYLKDLDNSDSQVQPVVRLMMAKLNLVKNKYDDAIKIFQTLIAPDKDVQPPPEIGQQYEARYFSNVAMLDAGKLADAQKGLEALVAWQKQSMPKDEATQKGIAAASEMLRYRIQLAQASSTQDPATKKEAETAATTILLKLSQERPDLRGVIYQQLVERLPKETPINTMDPLLLQGLMAKAVGEANKPEGQPVDKDALQRGLEAAQELVDRKNAPTITPQQRDDAARVIPALLEALDKKLEAANDFLKYARQNATARPKEAQDALDDAGRLTFMLRKTSSDDPAVADLYDRFLPVAIAAPFNKTQLAFFYGQRLRLQSKPQEAIKYFQMVPKDDRNYAGAQYYTMQATQDLLDNPRLTETQRAVLAADLVRQAEAVRQQYQSAQDPAVKERAAIATLAQAKAIGADQKKPQQAIQLLDGFEQLIAGSPNEKILAGDALLTRVNAYVAMGQLKQATDALVALLNQTGGAQGAEFVRGLLDRLDKELERAEAASNTKAMGDIARSEADLSGFLVEWAKNSPNAEIKKFTYQYMVFDARTKRLAGSLAQDGDEKKKLLEQAMNAYKQLQSPENVARYKQTLDARRVANGDIDPNQPDPNVSLGIALTDYEMKDYADASKLLGDLLNNGKLGGPTLAQNDASGNEARVVDNDVYWDATYKLYRSNIASAGEAGLDGTKRGLKNLLIRGGIPGKWQEQYEALRKEIIPEFNVASLAATQPVSSR